MLSGTHVGMQYLNAFKAAYTRNNKSKKKKKMRCFPDCTVGGHCMEHFCGQGVRVQVESTEANSFHVLGCFRCNREQLLFVVGQEYQWSSLRSFIEENSMVEGKPGSVPGTFDILPGSGGWNYMYSANSTRGKACHSFQTFCFQSSHVEPGGLLLCVGCCTSPLFSISSTKRSKKKCGVSQHWAGSTPASLKEVQERHSGHRARWGC